jgi:hypothetical protein
MEAASARECVLRALAASEIAESSTSLELRNAFEALAAQWLEAAGEGLDEAAPLEPEN